MDGRVFLLAAAISATLPLAAALRITEICPRPEEADPNSRESGWIELYNDGFQYLGTVVESADLEDAKLQTLHWFVKGDSLAQMDIDGCRAPARPDHRPRFYIRLR